jgi:hypothetical protein
MRAFSASYVRAVALCEKGDLGAAHVEFRKGCFPAVQRLHDGSSLPHRRRLKSEEAWRSWTRNLWRLTAQAATALDLRANEPKTPKEQDRIRAEALKALQSIRRHVHALHVEMRTVKSNDCIYALNEEASRNQPGIEEFSKWREALKRAECSLKATARPEEYEKALGDWDVKIGPILEDDVIKPEELGSLRAATRTLYRAFGRQFE